MNTAASKNQLILGEDDIGRVFSMMSFNTSCSGLRFAYICFRRCFFSSGAFIRFTSPRLLPPYLALQLQNVALLEPCWQLISSTATPASDTFKMLTI
jgi:hypothetical protein